MSSLYLTLLAVLVSGFAGKDQVTLAGLAKDQGKRPTVLAVGMLVSGGTAAFAAWAAIFISEMLVPDARLFLSAVALGLAGLESLILAPRVREAEPTHSLIATSIVLAMHQLTDSARFLIFGIAVATNAPLAAGIGGALGGMVLVAAAWYRPENVTGSRARLVRRLVGAALIVLALYLGFHAIGKI